MNWMKEAFNISLKWASVNWETWFRNELRKQKIKKIYEKL